MISSYIIYHIAVYNLIITTNLLKISEETFIILLTISYLVKGVGNFFSGYLLNYKSRKILVLFSISVILVLNILISIEMNI